MRIDFTLTDDQGRSYSGSANLEGSPPVSHADSRKTRSGGTKIKSLPDHLLDLRTEGFFGAPRTAHEVHENLQSRYPCQSDRVMMALLRLQRKKELRKTVKLLAGKSHVAYAW